MGSHDSETHIHIIGPIVRVNPAELSINDPDFYSEVYVTANVRRTDKYAAHTEGVNINGVQHPSNNEPSSRTLIQIGSHTFTASHDLHRRRRQPLDPFFSKIGVVGLEPRLRECVCRLCERIEEFKNSSAIIRLDHAFFALTGDIISQISHDEHQNFMEDPDFSPFW